ncbi:MAG: hypothetical protein U5K71_00570 [Gracilimonas sp.]|nr:hypothetical protein [Gracilimonas sp.]
MSGSTFFRTVICGFIATFAMAMVAFFQSGIGLPVIDVGHILTESFNEIHGTGAYHIIFGNLAFNIGGVMLALIWVVYLQHRIPGNWFVQGLIYGVIISILAGLVVSPFVSAAAGESFGIFYSNTWVPGKFIFAGLLMHVAYGLVLTQSLKVADVGEMNG